MVSLDSSRCQPVAFELRPHRLAGSSSHWSTSMHSEPSKQAQLDNSLTLLTHFFSGFSRLLDNEDECYLSEWMLKRLLSMTSIYIPQGSFASPARRFHFTFVQPRSISLYTSVYPKRAMTTKAFLNWKLDDPNSSTKYGGIFRASSAIP